MCHVDNFPAWHQDHFRLAHKFILGVLSFILTQQDIKDILGWPTKLSKECSHFDIVPASN